MATEKTATGTNPTSNPTNGKGARGKRQTREEKGLQPLTAIQKQQRAMVQQAQNSCNFIKAAIDRNEPIKAEVLAACSTLSGALSSMIGA